MERTKTENRVAFESLLKRAREEENFRPRVYLSGIGGIGVSAVAHLLLDMGWKVCGADLCASHETETLSRRGAKIYLGHSAENIRHEPLDAAVYSSAVRRESSDIVELQVQGIPLLRRAEALAAILELHRGICVAGMHGKTTVSGLLTSALCHLGLEPGYAVGGIAHQFHPHARMGKSRQSWFVAETDESDGSLLEFAPEYAFILNLDRDHLDYYGSEERIEKVFARFAGQVKKKILCCGDNPWVMHLGDENFKDRRITFGLGKGCEYRAIVEETALPGGGQLFAVQKDGQELGDFKIRLVGEHNVSNATGIIALLSELGYCPEEIGESLRDFEGTCRRQEILFKNEDYRIIDDYGHHPAEIAATIRAVKKQGARLLVVFQPHRFSRTQMLLNEFSTCFKGADRLFMTDVYAASEDPIAGVSGRSVAEAVRARGQEVEYLECLEEVGDAVSRNSRPGDVILFLGAGDITREAHKYAAVLEGALN